MAKEGERIVSIRMAEGMWRLLAELGKKRGGLSMTAMIRLLVQEAAKREGVK